MTINEAVLEMRYDGIPEEDIEDIMEICKKKGLSPQNIDIELAARGLEKVFSFEYEGWYEGQAQPEPAHKPPLKEALVKEKK